MTRTAASVFSVHSKDVHLHPEPGNREQINNENRTAPLQPLGAGGCALANLRNMRKAVSQDKGGHACPERSPGSRADRERPLFPEELSVRSPAAQPLPSTGQLCDRTPVFPLLPQFPRLCFSQ